MCVCVCVCVCMCVCVCVKCDVCDACARVLHQIRNTGIACIQPWQTHMFVSKVLGLRSRDGFLLLHYGLKDSVCRWYKLRMGPVNTQVNHTALHYTCTYVLGIWVSIRICYSPTRSAVVLLLYVSVWNNTGDCILILMHRCYHRLTMSC